MKVLTQKEYDKVSRKKKSTANKDKAKSIKVVSEVPKKVAPKVMYRLLHPENGVDFKLTFEDELILEGVVCKRVCTNGIVNTEQEELKNFLLSKGYELLETIKEGDL